MTDAAAPAKRWTWKKALGVIGVFVLIAVLGFGYGILRGIKEEEPKRRGLISESERPQRLETMRRTVGAFYSDPTAATGQAAWDAIYAYRRTFADADLEYGVEPSVKVVCGDNKRECEMMKEQAQRKQDLLISELVGKHSRAFSQSSPEWGRAMILDLALDRRITESVATGSIEQYLQRSGQEKKLADMRGRFFADIDEKVSAYRTDKNAGVAIGPLLTRLKIYADESKSTMKEIKFGRQCPSDLRGFKDGELCDTATREINTVFRMEPPARVAFVKKALENRDAPYDALKSAICQTFDVITNSYGC
jgi:hypothetical protein